MPQIQTKSPDVKMCRRLYEQIDEIINAGQDIIIVDNNETVGLIKESDLVAMRDALEWVYVFLMNRRDYHKRRNAKSKVELELLEEKLRSAGVNVDEVKRRAAARADDLLIDESNDEAL